jgi:hypothetical protein
MKKKPEIQEEISKYPMLADAIDKVQGLLVDATEIRKPLLEKWLERLIKTEKEMRHLERIETLANALTERTDSEESEK